MDSKIIFISGVYSGILNGQLVTLRSVSRILMSVGRVYKIDRSTLHFFSFLFILLITAVKPSDRRYCYILLHRTRLGFWFRDFPVLVVCLLARVRVVTHLVGNDLDHFLCSISPIERSISKLLFRSVSCWVVIGPKMEEMVKRVLYTAHFPPPFVRAAGCYDPLVLGPEITPVVSRYYDVCFMSNFIASKGIIDFVGAIVILREDYGCNVRVWIAGAFLKDDNNVRAALQLAAQKSYIEILPPVEGRSKAALLGNTKLFVLPTYYTSESLPLSMVDAMATGCVCVSTDRGEIASLLDDSRGFIVPPRSPRALANVLHSVLAQPDLMSASSETARKFVLANFSSCGYEESIKGAVLT